MFPSFGGKVFSSVVATSFIIVPAVNHGRMLFAIRRHNNLIAGAAVSSELSAMFRREKKVALDMAILILVLLFSLAPLILNKIIIENFFPKLYGVLMPWGLTFVSLISALNPLWYILRNKTLRDEMRYVFVG